MIRYLGQNRVDGREPTVRCCEIQTCKDADELVTAVTNDQVVRTQMFSQRVRDGEQQSITGGMAQRIIDFLEAIDVHEDEYERLLRSLYPSYLARQFNEPWPTKVCTSHPIDGRVVSVLRGGRAIRLSRDPITFGSSAFVGRYATICMCDFAVEFRLSSCTGILRAVLRGALPVGSRILPFSNGLAEPVDGDLNAFHCLTLFSQSVSLLGCSISQFCSEVTASGRLIPRLSGIVAIFPGLISQFCSEVTASGRLIPCLSGIIAILPGLISQFCSEVTASGRLIPCLSGIVAIFPGLISLFSTGDEPLLVISGDDGNH
jgi:hypothetical protein